MDYKLKDQDILYELFNITDDMAIDSDIVGDSDADDITPISRQITSSGKRTRSNMQTTNQCENIDLHRPTISPSQKRSKSNVEVISTYESHIATKIATNRCCFRCSTKKHDKRSNMMCATCNKVLCKDCFAEYHKT